MENAINGLNEQKDKALEEIVKREITAIRKGIKRVVAEPLINEENGSLLGGKEVTGARYKNFLNKVFWNLVNNKNILSVDELFFLVPHFSNKIIPFIVLDDGNKQEKDKIISFLEQLINNSSNGKKNIKVESYFIYINTICSKNLTHTNYRKHNRKHISKAYIINLDLAKKVSQIHREATINGEDSKSFAKKTCDVIKSSKDGKIMSFTEQSIKDVFNLFSNILKVSNPFTYNMKYKSNRPEYPFFSTFSRNVLPPYEILSVFDLDRIIYNSEENVLLLIEEKTDNSKFKTGQIKLLEDLTNLLSNDIDHKTDNLPIMDKAFVVECNSQRDFFLGKESAKLYTIQYSSDKCSAEVNLKNKMITVEDLLDTLIDNFFSKKAIEVTGIKEFCKNCHKAWVRKETQTNEKKDKDKFNKQTNRHGFEELNL